MKQQICHHCTNCHGDRVKSQTYWYYTVHECMLITLYRNFQETLHAEWMGDSTSLGWLGNMLIFKLFFLSHLFPSKTPCETSLVPHSVCRILFLCRLWLCCLQYKVCHWCDAFMGGVSKLLWVHFFLTSLILVAKFVRLVGPVSVGRHHAKQPCCPFSKFVCNLSVVRKSTCRVK